MIKHLIQACLRTFGWELHRFHEVPEATMADSLQWLSQQQISVKTVLDVGASDGRWAVDCLEFYPEAAYFLFEPQPVHREALEAFIQGKPQSITPVYKAVGAEVGTCIFDAATPFGGVVQKESSATSIEVELTTLDAYLSSTPAQTPYLLKLDTHGIERSILDGAAKTLESCSVLVIEAYNFHITDEAILFWELCAYLAQRGFRPARMVDVKNRLYDNALWQMDIIFIRDDWNGFQYVQYE